MRKFTWEVYYDNFYDWAESTQISCPSGLTSFDSAEEICEIADAFFDEKAASKLIWKTVAAGEKFTAEQSVDLTLAMDKPALNQMAEVTSDLFSREQLEELYDFVDDDIFECISKKSHVDTSGESSVIVDAIEKINKMDFAAFEKPIGYAPSKTGSVTKLAIAAGMVGGMGKREQPRKPTRSGRRCNGDWANCPPHYGYRYGRRYYGHNHTEGCQFAEITAAVALAK